MLVPLHADRVRRVTAACADAWYRAPPREGALGRLDAAVAAYPLRQLLWATAEAAVVADNAAIRRAQRPDGGAADEGATAGGGPAGACAPADAGTARQLLTAVALHPLLLRAVFSVDRPDDEAAVATVAAADHLGILLDRTAHLAVGRLPDLTAPLAAAVTAWASGVPRALAAGAPPGAVVGLLHRWLNLLATVATADPPGVRSSAAAAEAAIAAYDAAAPALAAVIEEATVDAASAVRAIIATGAVAEPGWELLAASKAVLAWLVSDIPRVVQARPPSYVDTKLHPFTLYQLLVTRVLGAAAPDPSRPARRPRRRCAPVLRSGCGWPCFKPAAGAWRPSLGAGGSTTSKAHA